MIFFPVQCRMARAALGLGVRELAAAAKVSVDTVARFERGDELKERTIDALQRALEAAGVEFTNGDQPGVRLTKAPYADSVQSASAPKPTAVGESGRWQDRQGDREETIGAAPRNGVERSLRWIRGARQASSSSTGTVVAPGSGCERGNRKKLENAVQELVTLRYPTSVHNLQLRYPYYFPLTLMGH